VEIWKEYELEVTEISKQGDGVARVHGFVVFVKGGKVGQKAKVKIGIELHLVYLRFSEEIFYLETLQML
jgi:hypothetical protein